MFKFDLLNYKTTSYILLLLSLFTILFDVTYLNQLLFVSVLIFSILQNIMQYKFKTIVSSIVALIVIYLQFNLSAHTFSKEFFLNLILILVFIKFSEINTELEVMINEKKIKCIVVEKPFFDPKKQITAKSL